MHEFLIGEQGEDIGREWVEHQAANSCRSDAAVDDYAVRHLNCIRLRLVSHTAYVTLEPTQVSALQLTALLRHLSEMTFDMLVLVSYADAGRHHEIIPGKRRALAQVRQRLKGARNQQSPGRIKRYGIHALSEHHPFAELAGYWKPQFSLREIGQLIERTALFTHERFSLMEYRGPTSDFVFREHGSGYPQFATHYMETWIGRNVLDHPDPNYARSCARSFELTARTRTIAIEKVDCLIYWPMVGRVRRVYTRALFPFFDPAGRSWVMSTSLAGNGIAT